VSNTAPVAVSKKVEVEQNKSRDLELGGTDVDHDNLTVIITSQPLHGDVMNGVYTPDKDYYGSDELTFKVSDGSLESAEVVVTLSIVDLTPPSVMISVQAEGVIESVNELAYFELKVSEPIKEDILTSNLLVTGGEIKSFEGGGQDYVVAVQPYKNSNAPIKLSLSSGAIKDLSDNSNEQSNVSIRAVDTQRAFVTVWQTTNEGVSGDKQVEIMAQQGSYDYTVDWGDGSIETSTKRKIKHTYQSPGIYEIKIKGDYPGLFFSEFAQETDAKKLLKVTQWGSIVWSSMNRAFSGCSVMVGEFMDVPDMTDVTDMNYMFAGARVFNSDLSEWDVSSVIKMAGVFSGADRFNQHLSSWNTSSVVDMSKMFLNAAAFNGSVEGWDTSKVTSFFSMFKGAKNFNQRLNSWNTLALQRLDYMFFGASVFNRDIGSWNTSSVTSMEGTFKNAVAFNGNVRSWDTGKVVTTKFMFEGAASFNRAINVWNMSSNKFMNEMFAGATEFDQDLSFWDVSSAKLMSDMFIGTSMSEANLNKLKSLWPLL